jgi:hypothetical protein
MIANKAEDGDGDHYFDEGESALGPFCAHDFYQSFFFSSAMLSEKMKQKLDR